MQTRTELTKLPLICLIQKDAKSPLIKLLENRYTAARKMPSDFQQVAKTMLFRFVQLLLQYQCLYSEWEEQLVQVLNYSGANHQILPQIFQSKGRVQQKLSRALGMIPQLWKGLLRKLDRQKKENDGLSQVAQISRWMRLKVVVFDLALHQINQYGSDDTFSIDLLYQNQQHYILYRRNESQPLDSQYHVGQFGLDASLDVSAFPNQYSFLANGQSFVLDKIIVSQYAKQNYQAGRQYCNLPEIYSVLVHQVADLDGAPTVMKPEKSKPKKAWREESTFSPVCLCEQQGSTILKQMQLERSGWCTSRFVQHMQAQKDE